MFAVPSSWAGNEGIKEEYLEKIKKICSDLSLNPIGFVVLSEALANYIKIEEGGHLNGIVFGIASDTLEVSIFKLGKLIGSAQVARSVSLVEDVTEGLMRFQEKDVLPSRFILYNGKDSELEEARQNAREMMRLSFIVC